MKLHGIVFIVVGLFVAILSEVIDGNDLILFVFAGIAMSLFGIYRIWSESRRPAQPNGSAYTARHTRVTQNQQFSVKYCIFCGYQLHPHAQYCSRCRGRQ